MYKILLVTPHNYLYHCMNSFQINYSVKPSTKTRFGGSHQQPYVAISHKPPPLCVLVQVEANG